MNVEELVQLNNEKQKQLSTENKKYYEDMLVYVRLSYDKSDQETEEILVELLDHLVEAQAEGKMAEDVFGKEPKKYADEIIGELPKMVTKQRMQYFVTGMLYFLAAVSLYSGIATLFTHYVLGIESLTKTYYIGTLALKTLINIPVAFALLYVLLRYFRWFCFKKINKVMEFLLLWIYGVISLGLFMLVIFVTPDFGPTVQTPFYMSILFGAILYLIGRKVRKAI
ncbi:DUF1129 family protein [Tetragenococcus koreensis]|uniref:DUF1129 domain-containing protein n=1 Tax=Tetragenococcus koreensis TaxID=290335 RepID=A0AAN4UAP9_9ENTE|nr:DUF1129 family protein [Tetragenococcus koreensis]MCF1584605.1 DUF1129 family protein [Tetragenococcus koreensis]MCF1614157.1 DUF1129 family protein [Tetragenococcus koreensis]MCF1617395.1 DUF1129 family protein [Tetragenococcus koreensis]MCF1619693.1 DUF1129 family protein [Tetragenococcus koreensis]MCF1622183.1 DUF1129 family protein [Tetragenococcus koreensis]